MRQPVFTYRLLDDQTPQAYDEAVAASCLQGLYNKAHGPAVYLLSQNKRPQYWLDLFSREGEWLFGREQREIAGLDDLLALARDCVSGAVIWDPAVPATLNVATTVAGVEKGVVLSPELAGQCLRRWNIPVIIDLTGRFDGSLTGSRKNDAYRWAIQHYQARCSNHFLFLFEDACLCRAKGSIEYVVTRDWAVYQSGFVYDLSPWGDVTPGDDEGQPLGTDLATYHLLLQNQYEKTAGKELTEVAGFFSFAKYSNVDGHPYPHEPVPTEWETVYLITPYNCYQNTVAHNCFNQSFHSQYECPPLKQGRPPVQKDIQNKVYLGIHMCDYDSAYPLYDFLPDLWAEGTRGSLPLAWGVNPNLVESYPDLIEYFYKTRSSQDFFVGDASAAGYFNPSRVRPEHWDLLIAHNRRFYEALDMSLSPMILDWVQPSPQVLDAFRQFSPDGVSSIIYDFHQLPVDGSGPLAIPPPRVHHGLVADTMYNGINVWTTAEDMAATLTKDLLTGLAGGRPWFFYIRITWINAGQVAQLLDAIRAANPHLDVELLDPYNYFGLHKRFLSAQ